MRSFALVLCFWLLESNAFSARFLREPLEPYRHAKVSEPSTYKKCLTKYFEIWSKDRKKRNRDASVEGCAKKFPELAKYRECKQVGFAKFRKGEATSKNALKYCDLILEAASFREDDPLPLRAIAGKTYFAGVDMRSERPLQQISIPNFNCDHLNQAVAGKGKSWQIYLPGRGASPAGVCRFGADPGAVYSDLQLVFAISRVRKKLIPVQGIAFYRKDFSDLTSRELIKKLLRQLGPKHRVFGGATEQLFGAAAWGPLDQRQFPGQICQTNSGEKRVAYLRNQNKKQPFPRLLHYINLRHLCKLPAKR